VVWEDGRGNPASYPIRRTHRYSWNEALLVTTVVGAEMHRRLRLLNMGASGVPCIPTHDRLFASTPRAIVRLLIDEVME
jgi:hypothetical protein